ncbi:prephenate dehydratase [Clostridium sp. Marseille-Q2269]|uniref:prephenate dehydratase n=1 Tax=Clostridium sp. Marseille-Q2269 TaxID=2942205 RepID=UPI002073C491|nr:prephenate dehydratase [Clostridium sp. Marseille-Q2269]
MNKNELNQLRNQIDEIDEQLIKLFEKRMNIVVDVAKYKKENNMPIFNSEREKEVLKKNVDRLKNENFKLYAEEFFKDTMSISRKYQSYKMFCEDNKKESKENLCMSKNHELIFNENNKIGFQGLRGSFSEQALFDYFGENINTINFETFEDVFINLKNKVVDYAILPLENSSTGAIVDVYDLLRKYEFYIIGEKCIKVEHNIVGIKGSKLESIKEIYSHPQAFQQSSNFLNKYYNRAKLIPYYNTAISAEFIKNEDDISKAAISSKRASQIYGLEILKENINNNNNNNTRFIIIGRELIDTPNNNKISVAFSLEHKAGTLYNVLRYFSDNDLNMLKIESRPTGNKNWTYLFYIDFEGNNKSGKVNNALNLIKENSECFKIMGSYIKDQSYE